MSRTTRSPFELEEEQFRKVGHQLIDTLADFLSDIRNRRITPGEKPSEVQALLGNRPLPGEGCDVGQLFEDTSKMLIDHSLFNGHPKFFGYITGAPAPVGILADLLASAMNPNVGAQILSPIATEIEKQTVGWLCDFIGVPSSYGGVLVSGGNMANITAFLAGRTAMTGAEVRTEGLRNSKWTTYCSKTTHTWLEKAANLSGLGMNSVRWVGTDADNRISISALEETIENDLREGFRPMMIIGTAGDVSTGVVDDLKALSVVSKKYNVWFHVDGAYGIPAAVVPELRTEFEGIEEADSIAMDPHKWLYSPLEAGCTLVKNPQHLVDTYSSHPAYYNFNTSGEDTERNFYEYGFQNSRGFRTLKVWMALRHVGKDNYVKSIREDIALAKLFYDLAMEHPNLEVVTHYLSIATFRYIPGGIDDKQNREAYLNELNELLLNQLQAGGEIFLSNAVKDDRYCLRACIVNFRTTVKDIEESIAAIVLEGEKAHAKLSGTPK